MMKSTQDPCSKEYKVISFDMDGVLLDSEDFSVGSWIYRMVSKTLSHFNVPTTPDNMKKLYMRNMVDNYDKICRDFGIEDPHKLWQVREKHFLEEKLNALRKGEIKPFEDANVVKELNDGYKLSIVTNSPQPIADYFLKRYELEEYFELWIGRGSDLSDLFAMKPNPHLLNRMMSKIDSRDVLYIGDTDQDRQAAKSAGVDFLLLSRVEEGNSAFSNLWELKNCLKSGF